MNKKILILTAFVAFVTPQIVAQVCPHDSYWQCDNCCHMDESAKLESAEADFDREKQSCAIRTTIEMSDILSRYFPDPFQMFNEVTSSAAFRECIKDAQDERAARKKQISEGYNDCRIDCCGLYPDC